MKISFHSHASENKFSYQKMSTRTRFKKEAKGNSEMAYYLVLKEVVASLCMTVSVEKKTNVIQLPCTTLVTHWACSSRIDWIVYLSRSIIWLSLRDSNHLYKYHMNLFANVKIPLSSQYIAPLLLYSYKKMNKTKTKLEQKPKQTSKQG